MIPPIEWVDKGCFINFEVFYSEMHLMWEIISTDILPRAEMWFILSRHPHVLLIILYVSHVIDQHVLVISYLTGCHVFSTTYTLVLTRTSQACIKQLDIPVINSNG